MDGCVGNERLTGGAVCHRASVLSPVVVQYLYSKPAKDVRAIGAPLRIVDAEMECFCSAMVQRGHPLCESHIAARPAVVALARGATQPNMPAYRGGPWLHLPVLKHTHEPEVTCDGPCQKPGPA